jgi:DHA2 family lincomycin resistance protein-like MFS transporter
MNPFRPANQVRALVMGIQHAYLFATIIAIIGLACSFLIKRVLVGQTKELMVSNPSDITEEWKDSM